MNLTHNFEQKMLMNLKLFRGHLMRAQGVYWVPRAMVENHYLETPSGGMNMKTALPKPGTPIIKGWPMQSLRPYTAYQVFLNGQRKNNCIYIIAMHYHPVRRNLYFQQMFIKSLSCLRSNSYLLSVTIMF